MIKEALQWIVDQSEKTEFYYENGQQYTNKQLKKLSLPTRDTMEIATLSGLVEFIKSGFDHDQRYLILIDNFNSIQVFTELNINKVREKVLQVTAELPDITFDRFMDTENFIIQLQSVFVATDERDKVLKLVGNLKTEGIKTQSDDGISQVVQVKQGVATVGNEVVPNPITLKPYRTFTEVTQPETEFVFRLRQNGNGEVGAALFEADGGVWKNIARASIKEYLSKELEHMPVTIIG